MSLAEKLVQIKFIRWGFNENYWLWVHILAGIVVAQIQFLRGESFLVAMLTALTVAVGWELIEVGVGMYRRRHHSKPFVSFIIDSYGMVVFVKHPDNPEDHANFERWVYDTAGDIIGTMLAAGLSSLFLLGAIL